MTRTEMAAHMERTEADARAAEILTADAISTWLRCRTEARAGHRRVALAMAVRLRLARGANRAALRRLAGWRVEA